MGKEEVSKRMGGLAGLPSVQDTHRSLNGLLKDIQDGLLWVRRGQYRALSREYSALVESTFILFPIGLVWIESGQVEPSIVLDGNERLWALYVFRYEGACLGDLHFLPELSGKTWDEIPRRFQRRFEETSVSVALVTSPMDEETRSWIIQLAQRRF